MMTHAKTSHRSPLPAVAITLLWIITYLGARLALKGLELDSWLRIAVALVPVVPTALFLWSVVSAVRSLDELQRRIHLEALAIAFPLSILLLWTLGLLQLAINLNPDDWGYRHVWVYLPLFYFVGLAFARRRYQ